jgi:hypothetical protein
MQRKNITMWAVLCVGVGLAGCAKPIPNAAGFLFFPKTVDRTEGYTTECALYTADGKAPGGIPMASTASPNTKELVVRCMFEKDVVFLKGRRFFEYKYNVALAPNQNYEFYTRYTDDKLLGWFLSRGKPLTPKLAGTEINP